MKRWFACLFLLVTGSALAQYGPGVLVNVDAATGARRCAHSSVNSLLDRTGISLVSSQAGLLIGVTRAVTSWSAAQVFDPARKRGSERVVFEFAEGDVLVAEPFHVGGDPNGGYEMAGFDDAELLSRLLAATQDVRVRFDGPVGQAAFVISYDVIRDLAEGFGQVCI
jgi:hypothetical protein